MSIQYNYDERTRTFLSDIEACWLEFDEVLCLEGGVEEKLDVLDDAGEELARMLAG